MALNHVVRVGALGNVGRFAALDRIRYPRGTRVVVRTDRGLELGDVLVPPAQDEMNQPADGSILRAMTIQDQLLEERLDRHRQQAWQACQARLDALACGTALLDVEHLFDGQTLIFYFLGEIDSQVQAITDELAQVYDAQVQFRAFAASLTEGCGPGCGTAEATNGCTTCATGCAVADACSPRRSRKESSVVSSQLSVD